jgi:hypothetical protein
MSKMPISTFKMSRNLRVRQKIAKKRTALRVLQLQWGGIKFFGQNIEQNRTKTLL